MTEQQSWFIIGILFYIAAHMPHIPFNAFRILIFASVCSYGCAILIPVLRMI